MPVYAQKLSLCTVLSKSAFLMDEWSHCKLEGWSNTLSNALSCYFEVNFGILLLYYFSLKLFVCAITYTFSTTLFLYLSLSQVHRSLEEELYIVDHSIGYELAIFGVHSIPFVLEPNCSTNIWSGDLEELFAISYSLPTQ